MTQRDVLIIQDEVARSVAQKIRLGDLDQMYQWY
jgi:hypothetical protein